MIGGADHPLPRGRGPGGPRGGVVGADGSGRAVAFRVAPGQAHGPPHAVPRLDRLPGAPRRVVAARGHACHACRDHVWTLGARPAVPARRDEAAVAGPDRAHATRARVERLWGRSKERRAVATRHETTARSILGGPCRAASIDRLSP
jgi:hypothetical protein